MIFPAYPGRPLKNGDWGPNVNIMQACLNYITNVYPVSPKITGEMDFGTLTEGAVRGIQGIVNLPIDGVIDEKSWYAILAVANFLAN